MDKNGFKITSTKKVVPSKNLLPYESWHYTTRSVTSRSKGLIAQLLQTVLIPTVVSQQE